MAPLLDSMFLAIFLGACLVGIAALTSLFSIRLGAPLLLVFLGVGLLAGEDGFGLVFNDAKLAYFVGNLALAVILFDSGFKTRLAAFRVAALPAISLATLGVLLTAILVGAVAHLWLELPWLQAFLIGAVIGSTDAAAVFLLLRVGGIAIRERVRSTLEIESGSNDPMAIFLTLALVELILADGGEFGGLTRELLAGFTQQMGLGFILGLFGGFLIVRLINRLDLEPGLYPVIMISASLALFGAVGMIGGSGFLAVYVAGLYAGNRRVRSQGTLRRFSDGLTWMSQIGMFVVLGLLATPSHFPAVALHAVGLAMFLTFVGRPLAVWLCLLPFRFRPEETAFIAWVGLRGAVSILLAILPLASGIADGGFFFNVTFIIVLTSLLLQGWTIPLTARRLGLVAPPDTGPLDKVELDLPGDASHELLVYRVVSDSPIARGERIPRWAQPSLVVRDGQSMRFHHAGRLKPGDRVYLFASPRHAKLLDRIFARSAPLDVNDKDFFGEFVADPEKTLAELAQAYEFAISPADPGTTIGKFIEMRLGGGAEVGDRVSCGGFDLVVRKASDKGKVEQVGIAITPHLSRVTRIPIFLNARQIWDRLYSRFGAGNSR